VAHQLGRAPQQLRRHDDDGRRAVADFFVLQLGQVDQYLE